jgi:hypothetical protein
VDKVIAVVVAALLGPLLFVVGLTALAAGQPAFGGEPSQEALADIPAELLALYHAAAQGCPGLSWAVVAAIGKVETDHGRFGDAQLLSDGRVEPWIIGIALDGTRGTRAIRDTDGGRWDRDTVWDRAVGPMQFIPSTWRAYGVDATGSGTADPHNLFDAVHTAVAYLCANGAGDPATLRQAILAYNRADWYADEVLAIAQRYAHPSSTVGGQVVGDYALPVDRERLTVGLLRRPHHTYPAWDLALPVGTPVYAATAGTVIAVTDDARCGRGVVIAGLDGARYTYCYAHTVTVARGASVAAGAPIMTSGNTGRSTGPHLHFQIHVPGRGLVCPQPILEAWFTGVAATPFTAPMSGCTT